MVSVFVRRNGYKKPTIKITFDPKNVSWERFRAQIFEKLYFPVVGEIFSSGNKAIRGFQDILSGMTYYAATCGNKLEKEVDIDFTKCALFHENSIDCYDYVHLGDTGGTSKIKVLQMIHQKMGGDFNDFDIFREDNHKAYLIEDDEILTPPINLKLGSLEKMDFSLIGNDSEKVTELLGEQPLSGDSDEVSADTIDYIDTLSLHSTGSYAFFGGRKQYINLGSIYSDANASGTLVDEARGGLKQEPLCWLDNALLMKDMENLDCDLVEEFLIDMLMDNHGRQFLWQFAAEHGWTQYIEFLKLYVLYKKEYSRETAEMLLNLISRDFDIPEEIKKKIQEEGKRVVEQREAVMVPITVFDRASKYVCDIYRFKMLQSFFRSRHFESARMTKELYTRSNDKRNLNTPLHKAVLRNDCNKAKSLIEGGFTVNIMNKFGDSPLHHAVKTKRKQLVQLLLDNGAEINAKNFSGNTPLHIASLSATNRRGRSIVGLLCERGANMTLLNNEGKNVLNLSAHKKASMKLLSSFSQVMLCKIKGELDFYKDFITWDSSQTVRVDFFDEEHRQIISCINIFFNIVKQNEPVSKLLETFNQLVYMGMNHFNDEETALKAVDFPYLTSHLKAHNQIRRDLRRVHEKLKAGERVGTKALEVIHGWYTSHILVEDVKYGDFLLGVDVRSICI